MYYSISLSLSSISTNLPSTAYIKMIDIWLLFGLFKPFIDIIMHTYIETLRENPEEQKQEDVEKEAWTGKTKFNMDGLKYSLTFIYI